MTKTLSLSVMTWNLENLFPANDPSGSGPKTAEAYHRKMNNIARTILGIMPDVIGVQEVGNLDAFRDLQRRLNDRFPYARLSKYPDVRGIRVGFLSRLPLLQAQDLDLYPQESLTNIPGESGKSMGDMGRGALKATIVLMPGLLVNVMTAHLKSKLVTYAGGRRYPQDENERARGTALALIRRATEATAIRVWLNQFMTRNDEPMILMGDFNDEPNAVTTQLMMGPEDRSLADRDKFDDIRLYNLADYIPGERRYSRLYQKQKEMIDHIAVSHELIFYLRKADSYIEPIQNIDADTESRRESLYPDHAPVYARFEIPEDEADRHFSITR